MIEEEGIVMSDKGYLDLSRIEKHLLLENHLLMLVVGLQGDVGYIPLRVTRRDRLFYFLYDPIGEGVLNGPLSPSLSPNGITNLTFQQQLLFGSQNLPSKPTNIFAITIPNHIYQIFFGISPSYLRVFVAIPSTTTQGNLDIQTWSPQYNMFGYVDGFESPLNFPSPLTETFLIKDLDIAFAMVNPMPFPIDPLFNFVINRFEAMPVRDPDLVNLMLNRRVPVKYVSLTGLTTVSLSNLLSNFNVKDFVRMGMSPADIKKALSP